MNNFDEDIRDHCQALENNHMENIHAFTVFNVPSLRRPPMYILEEQIFGNKNNYCMKWLSNFTTAQFSELYTIVAPVISKRRHANANAFTKTKFFITRCDMKYYVAWGKISLYFGISSTYSYQITSDIFSTCYQVLKKEYIKRVSVSERITKYTQTYQDFRSLLGSLDVTVHRISKPKEDQC